MMRYSGAAGLWMLLAGGAGCLPIVPHYVDGIPTRRNVEKAVESSPELETLSREEALLRLGEPDAAPAGEGKWMYRWTKIKGVILLPPALVTRTYVLTVSFAEDGRIANLERLEYAGVVLGSPPPVSPKDFLGAWAGFEGFYRVLAAFRFR